MSVVLSYNENSLPGSSQAEQIQFAKEYNLALEIANDGRLRSETYQNSSLQITAVQAYLMHEFHPLHPEHFYRQQAYVHLRQTLELAARLAAPRVVSVCGFGQQIADCPFERSFDLFSSLVPVAESLGVRIMIEPLSPQRAAAMTDPQEIAKLIGALDRPDIFSLVLDTGHLMDSGFRLDTFFRSWVCSIEELQLKGMASAPPSSDWSIISWLKSLPSLPPVVCVEHRQPIERQDCEALVKTLQQSLVTLE